MRYRNPAGGTDIAAAQLHVDRERVGTCFATCTDQLSRSLGHDDPRVHLPTAVLCVQVYLTEAERIVLLSCFDIRPLVTSTSSTPSGGGHKASSSNSRAPTTSLPQRGDGPRDGVGAGSHRGLAFATGRFRGSRVAVAVSLLGVHMAVCEHRNIVCNEYNVH